MTDETKELYYALMEAAGRVCFCCTEDRTCGVVQPKTEWFMDNPEFCSVKDCKYKYWWYLLRKVRDGNEQNVDPMEATHTCAAKQL